MTDGGRVAFGAPDRSALRSIRETFQRYEPLVERATFDDDLNPTRLLVECTEGVTEPGRFEIRWSTTGRYGFQYGESELAFRFDFHPNPHSPPKHVHLPPDASETEASCIDVERPELVGLAVLERWRAVLADGPDVLNDGTNPP